MPRSKLCGPRSSRYGTGNGTKSRSGRQRLPDDRPAGQAPRGRIPGGRRRQGLLFLSPWIIGFLAFTAIPMLATLGFSFTNLDLNQEEPLRLIGFENYADLAGDSQVWQSLCITLRFAGSGYRS